MPPILIELQASRWLLTLLAVVHAVSLFTIATLQIDLAWRLALVTIVLVSVWQSLRTWRSSGRMRLSLGRNGQCEIDKAGGSGTVAVQDYSVIFNSLVVVTLVGEQGRQSLVLLPDSSDADSLRRLRVWLRASV